MHKIREITVGVCYVDSILEKAEEALPVEELVERAAQGARFELIRNA